MSSRTLTLLLAGCFLVGPSSATAEIAVDHSLEWLVDSSTSLGIYTADYVNEVTSGEHFSKSRLLCSLQEKLKGNPPKTFQFVYHHVFYESDPAPPEIGDEFLLFFEGEKPRLDHPRYSIHLNHPCVTGWNAVVYTADCRVLSSRDEIMGVVRERVALGRNVDCSDQNCCQSLTYGPSENCLFIPFIDQPYVPKIVAQKRMLIVPTDERTRHFLVKVAKTEEYGCMDRGECTFALSWFPGPETEELLKSLLDDPNSFSLTREGSTNRIFAVRQAAYQALQEIGFDVPKPEGYVEDYDYR